MIDEDCGYHFDARVTYLTNQGNLPKANQKAQQVLVTIHDEEHVFKIDESQNITKLNLEKLPRSIEEIYE